MICLTYPNIWRSFVCWSSSEGGRAVTMCIIIIMLCWGGFAVVCVWILDDDDNMCRRRWDGVLMRCVLVEWMRVGFGKKSLCFFLPHKSENSVSMGLMLIPRGMWVVIGHPFQWDKLQSGFVSELDANDLVMVTIILHTKSEIFGVRTTGYMVHHG